MATTHGTPTAAKGRQAPEPYDQRGEGWVSFAGIMIGLVGTLNIIYGIAAISNSKFYFQNATYVISDLKAYGWLTLCIGAVQLAAAFGIFSRQNWARWVGIISAAANTLVQVLWLPSYPLASLALMAIDILVIYGLVAYGKRSHAAF
jgi:hypothetical protein